MKNRAFTLVELMVVISIIAILSGIILTNLSSSKGKARDAKRISDMGQIQLALELYFDRCKQYPNVPPGPITNPQNISNGCPAGINLASYISQIPQPSLSASEYLYNYFVDGSKRDYVMFTKLEYPNDVLKDSILEGNVTNPDLQDYVAGVCTSGSLFYCLGPK